MPKQFKNVHSFKSKGGGDLYPVGLFGQPVYEKLLSQAVFNYL